MEQNWSRFETVFAQKFMAAITCINIQKTLTFLSCSLQLLLFWEVQVKAIMPPLMPLWMLFVDYRKEQGLPALSLSWGPWSEVGMAKDLVARHAKGGVIGLNPKEGMRALEAALLDSEAHLTIANINWKIFLKQMIEVPAWFKAFAEQKTGKEYLSEQLESVDVGERLIFIKEHVSTF